MKASTENAIYTTIAALMVVAVAIGLVHFGCHLPWGTSVFVVGVGSALVVGVVHAIKSSPSAPVSSVDADDLPFGNQVATDPDYIAPAKLKVGEISAFKQTSESSGKEEPPAISMGFVGGLCFIAGGVSIIIAANASQFTGDTIIGNMLEGVTPLALYAVGFVGLILGAIFIVGQGIASSVRRQS